VGVIDVDLDKRRVYLSLPYSDENVRLCRSIPGGRWVKAKGGSPGRWSYPLTPMICAEIHGRLADLGADEHSILTKMIRFGAWAPKVRDLSADELNHPSQTERDPWHHQIIGYTLLRRQAATLLAWDMGTGKTKAVVDFIRNAKDVATVLVVCPAAVVAVWANQIAEHAPGVSFYAANRGSVADRSRKAEQFWHRAGRRKAVVIVNYEAAWRTPFSKMIEARKQIDLAVADESHRIGDSRTRSARFMNQVVAPRARRRAALTGTLTGSGVMAVYGQFLFLDPGIFGTSVTKFRSKFCEMGGFQGKQVLGPANVDELNRRIYLIGHRVMKRDVLDLPPVVFDDRYIQIGKEARSAYDSMERDLIAKVKDGVMTAQNAIVKMVRLQQLTSGYAVVEEPSNWQEGEDGLPAIQWEDAARVVDDAKRKALAEYLQDLEPNEPVVVFARFIHDLSEIEAAALSVGRRCFHLSGRGNELADWQASTGGDVLAVQIQAGGVGVDLTRAAYGVYYSLDFSLINFDQSLARLDRHGQTRPVTYTFLLASDTIDPQIRKTLEAKRRASDDMMRMRKASQSEIVQDVIGKLILGG
jgi:SNF2 family DNA or RNA helicase